MGELRFDHVSVRYGGRRTGHTAVKDVDLVVPSGAVVGLVGESGSGKSTLARAAVGLTPVTAGSITLEGRDLLRSCGDSRPVQMVFQNPYSSLDPRMTIGESIAEALPRSERHDRLARTAEVVRLLELVNLDGDRAAALPGMLSGGQRQRVALARALAARPGVLVADEITSALDVSVQGAVVNLIRELQQQMGLTMLFISHNLAVVRYLSDYVAVMNHGELLEFGAADEVLTEPDHPYTRELLDSVPALGSNL
ncbi:ATP-binding cassette domain-containing protein [Nocardioides panzhihuensis]|uniref:Peptide/nickel transport system ATP-binding protein n=1 Tax=Nocardioides panzhihuensis TaxID=860243 RepID=A0A7Z0DL99_9ACTN|nr:peptide/nickel transport system ATP-binding protein [Nocardioides panzhihuensis]